MFEEIMIRAESKGKQIVMFLDYDGTLSPIVEDPDKAFITTEVCVYKLINNIIYIYYIKKEVNLELMN